MAPVGIAEITQKNKKVEMYVTFSGFPGCGGIKYNTPRVIVTNNGTRVYTEQVSFNNKSLQTGKISIDVETGDEVEVITAWDDFETRDGITRGHSVIATVTAE